MNSKKIRDTLAIAFGVCLAFYLIVAFVAWRLPAPVGEWPPEVRLGLMYCVLSAATLRWFTWRAK